METFIYHSDPGHGWLEVPRDLLTKLNIQKKITSFSYQKDDKVFLEHDQDAGTFLNAYKARYGEYSFGEHYRENNPIRNYARYKPSKSIANV